MFFKFGVNVIVFKDFVIMGVVWLFSYNVCEIIFVIIYSLYIYRKEFFFIFVNFCIFIFRGLNWYVGIIDCINYFGNFFNGYEIFLYLK